MDAARKAWSEFEAEERSDRTRAPKDSAPETALDKVLRFAPPAREGETDRAEAPTIREVTNAVNLIHGAALGIRAAEERTREAESRNTALMQRATEELKAAEARVQAAEGKVRAAEARAAEAEGRARDAEAWLRQLFSTITDELPLRG